MSQGVITNKFNLPKIFVSEMSIYKVIFLSDSEAITLNLNGLARLLYNVLRLNT